MLNATLKVHVLQLTDCRQVRILFTGGIYFIDTELT